MKCTMRILVGSLLIAAAPMAQAQTTGGDLDKQVRALDATAANRGQTQVAQKIAANFVNLAGSEENALALVNGLRNGTNVTLKSPTTTTGTSTSTTIDPPTGKMGWGNVKIALGLAQDALLRAGITNPTAAQLQAALNGGTITKADGTTVTLKGVLQMRADGMGWGQIAQAGGTKVGPVVSSLKSTQAELEKLPKTAAPTATAATAATPKGVTTANDVSSTSAGKGPSKGITTATGATSGSASRGLVTADGATSAHQPQGNAYGRGIVTAAGGGAGVNISATGKPSGAGVVNASGAGVAGVSTANGNAGGNGNGNGKGNGKGG
jgi:hypothetical protein